MSAPTMLLPHRLRLPLARSLLLACTLPWALAAVDAPATGPTPPALSAAPTAIAASYVAQLHDALDRKLALAPHDVVDGKTASRTLAWVALAAWELRGDATGAEHWLERLWAEQDLDPDSPTYGEFSWTLGAKDYRDKNALHFALLPATAALLRMGDHLPAAARAVARQHLQAGLVAAQRHQVKIGYTNIWLMKHTMLTLAGRYLGDAQAEATGYAGLQAWIGHLRGMWIHEFDSPTYYMVDQETLVTGRLLAATPEGRHIFDATLDLLWLDIAANFLPGRGTLAGAHSRDYDFVNGDGSIKEAFWGYGWRSDPPPPSEDLSKIQLYLGLTDREPYLPTKVASLAAKPQRLVCGTWGDERPGQDRTAWFDGAVCVSSASAWYGPQDKSIAIDFAQLHTPTLSIAGDRFDEPYGLTRTLDRSGHSKPTRLDIATAALQDRGRILALCDVRYDAKQAPEVGDVPLVTSALFPAHAEAVLLDGRPLTLTPGLDLALPVGSVLALRVGSGLATVRLLRADGSGSDAGAGEPCEAHILVEANGLTKGCARIAVRHHLPGRGTPPGRGSPQRSAWLLEGRSLAAGEDPDTALSGLAAHAAAARITESLDAGEWSVTVDSDQPQLRVATGSADRALHGRWLGGVPFSAPVFTVDGLPPAALLGSAIWNLAGPTLPSSATAPALVPPPSAAGAAHAQ